jgi:hypothetical protein
VADRDLDAVEEQRELPAGPFRDRTRPHAEPRRLRARRVQQGLHRNHIRPSLGSSP